MKRNGQGVPAVSVATRLAKPVSDGLKGKVTMVWFSYHGGHSGEFCAHAKSSLEEVVDTAIARGFIHYGLSEHCPRYRK
jgi:hypothetical protein